MKKYDRVKTIQLLSLVVIAASSVTMTIVNKRLFNMIGHDPILKFFFGLLWFLLLSSLIYILLDYRVIFKLNKNINELDMLVFSDPIAGIGNRYSCDAVIEQYLDKPLPEEIGCLTIAITNLKEINEKYSHMAGNKLIKDFSLILLKAAEKEKKCVLGRNGGNKFLVIFTECSEEQIDRFLDKIDLSTYRFNANSKEGEIEYQYGCAFDEGESVKTINELIALSNRRSIEKYRTFVEV